MKAHLTGRVYGEDLHYHEAMYLVMLTASVRKRQVETLDFTSVFQRSGMLERDVYLWPPHDVCRESHLWEMKRCINGLNDAHHSWCKSVNHELTNLKKIMSAYDNALFLLHDATGNLMGILAMYIDNIIFYGNDTFQRNVISESKRIFKFGTHENGTFKFLGLGVKQTKDGITTDQNRYASSLSPTDKKKGRSLKNYELSQEETDLQRRADQMMWVATQIWPNVSFDECRKSNTRKSLKVE